MLNNDFVQVGVAKKINNLAESMEFVQRLQILHLQEIEK